MHETRIKRELLETMEKRFSAVVGQYDGTIKSKLIDSYRENIIRSEEV